MKHTAIIALGIGLFAMTFAIADEPTGRSRADIPAAAGPNPPSNDGCDTPIFVGEFQTPFTNLDATTDGPDEPVSCEFFDYSHIESDVWFCYTTENSGMVTVSLCGSDYDTKMAVYDNACDGCPTDPPISCSDDNCGTASRHSRVVFPASQGDRFLIRVGGYEGEQGSGILNIFSGEEFASCDSFAGECDEANGSRGCNDVQCCEDICSIEPICCDVEWDEFCADVSTGICGDGFENCGPEAGDCLESNGSPGCSSEQCCQDVCAADPFCCIGEWDELCVNRAVQDTIACACREDAGACNTVSATPGCSNVDCCLAVCEADSFCCQFAWDEFCAPRVTEFCTDFKGDVDGDNDRDLDDYVGFFDCVSGEGNPYSPSGCIVFDFDNDGDVDFLDFGGFQAVFGVPI